jgi:preprotein translocase SecE subunit
MENNHQKWVNLSFVAAALLLAFVFYRMSTNLSVVFDIEGRVRSLDKILLGASAVVGLGIFLGLWKSATAQTFMTETTEEVSKVTWPTQDETLKATIFVLIAVTLAGFGLWLIDNAWVTVIGWILG